MVRLPAAVGWRTPHPTPSSPLPPALQEFYTDLKDAEREGEVNRILSAFKLNPFEQMNLHNNATAEEVRRQYRKVRGRGSWVSVWLLLRARRAACMLCCACFCTRCLCLRLLEIGGPARPQLLLQARRCASIAQPACLSAQPLV